ncbi:TPA: signal peptidase I [Streptococcus suis]|nr:signal peptidase I [Streptococcus suis]HEM5323478.1 signal peptidase I [Streptococcus suis]
MVKRDLIKQISLLVLLILGIIGLRFWLLEPVTITPEMANSYLKENDFIMTVRNVRPIHGDFILYNHEGKEYVSRVIAIEDETVTYMDDVLYRDNVIVTESYLKAPHTQESYTDDFSIATLTNGQYESIPKDYFLVLNDNRTNHLDSRSFGLIAEKDIIGRLTFRLSPLKEFGFIKTGLVQ